MSKYWCMTRWCVVYVVGCTERQTAWFSDPARARRALELVRAKGHSAVIYRD